MSIISRSLAVVLLLFSVATANAMSEQAHHWVTRMLEAGQTLNYKGNMIGVRGSNIELMGIIHKTGSDGEQERIYSLNGPPREIIRKSGELICYLPDQNMGLQGKLFSEQRIFPVLDDIQISKLDQYYSFELGEVGRVVGREAQMVSIMPRDEYRYGYNLWIDTETGLLLQSACVDNAGNALEQYMFTEVDINVPIAEADLQPSEQALSGLTWVQAAAPQPKQSKDMACKMGMLPAGYEILHAISKPATDGQNMMSQYVFSDGLSSFSLFIEHMYSPDKMEMDGAYQLGIVSVYSRVMDGNRITMMGEVPQVTAKAVAMAVSECE